MSEKAKELASQLLSRGYKLYLESPCLVQTEDGQKFWGGFIGDHPQIPTVILEIRVWRDLTKIDIKANSLILEHTVSTNSHTEAGEIIEGFLTRKA